MNVRIRIRIQDSFERLLYKVSLYFGATFQIAFEKYTFLNRFEKYLGS